MFFCRSFYFCFIKAAAAIDQKNRIAYRETKHSAAVLTFLFVKLIVCLILKIRRIENMHSLSLVQIYRVVLVDYKFKFNGFHVLFRLFQNGKKVAITLFAFTHFWKTTESMGD